ncbi:MAG: hypothetical protein GXP25_03855 [Planctomycetes bacterium]|nr:hypothetical protein [Planctomycetota bacterium]
MEERTFRKLRPFRKLKAEIGNRRFVIEEDLPDIGWYLYVFEGGRCVADHLQDTLQIAKRQALDDYGVPLDAWRGCHMTRNKHEPFLRVLEVAKDDLGRYAKIEVTLGGRTRTIRWGLDSTTYRGMRKAFTTRLFDSMSGAKYEYYLLLGYGGRDVDGEPRPFAVLETVQAHNRKNIEFPCSELLVGNLKWFRNVSSVDDLDDVDWEKFESG